MRPCDVTSDFSSLLPSLGRSVVYQQNSKESATLQPFFTLQLDIQSEKVRTVQEALESLVARESVQGYTTKTKQEVRTRSAVTHLHCFLHVFWKKHGFLFNCITSFLQFQNTIC